MDAAAFQRGFVARVASLTGTSSEVIAIDRKTSRRSCRKKRGKAAIPMVSAPWAASANARKITDQKADDVLAPKGKQGTLREEVGLFAAGQKANADKDARISRDQTVDGDHGRGETRTTTVLHDVAWLRERHAWPGLTGVVMVERRRALAEQVACESRFHITSWRLRACQKGPKGAERGRSCAAMGLWKTASMG